MASDEAMADAAANGLTSLRFYGWSAATVSLGYFQHAAVREADPSLAPLPWVRRPSGGATLVHHHELTYALALPAVIAGRDISSWIRRAHGWIADSLNTLIGRPLVESVADQRILGSVLCFQKQTVGDLTLAGFKIVGSAQRKHRGALVQHGSILLRQSEHAPLLPGIRELARVELAAEEAVDELLRRWPLLASIPLSLGTWSHDEETTIAHLRAEKYASDRWNFKR
ncbi:MAG: lipoate--protein ligase family protein [Gemmataceae bacterium]|nr:lipoate--protein ligase family protein [Gemmataceae bacterium]